MIGGKEMFEDDKVYYYQPYIVKTVAGFVTLLIFLQIAAITDWTGVTLGEKTIIILIGGYATIFGMVWFVEGINHIIYILFHVLQEYQWFRDLEKKISDMVHKK